MICAVDISAGGIWIVYIRQAMGASQLVVATPVTGSLVCCISFSHRDITRTVSFPWKRTVSGTEWVLQAGCQVLLHVNVEYCSMNTVSAKVDNCSGNTFEMNLGCTGGSGGYLLRRCDATARLAGCYRTGGSSGPCDGESHSTR